MEQRKRRKESGERVGKNREWGGENVREVKFIQGESGKSGGKKFKFFTESGGYVWRMDPYATNMCAVWIHTPQTCVAYGSIRHKHVWGSCGVWIHTPQRKPMRHKKFKFKFVCHVCVKFVTHKHVHAPQRKSIPVCVTFGEVIRDKQS